MTCDKICKESDEDQFIEFKMEPEPTIVLNVNDAINAGTETLKRRKIEHDRLENLLVNDIDNDGDIDPEPKM